MCRETQLDLPDESTERLPVYKYKTPFSTRIDARIGRAERSRLRDAK